MDNNFFLNVQFDSPNPSSIPTWQQFSNSTMEIQSPDFFLNSNSDPHPSFHFDSALSSMVSSPAVSNSNPSNESFVIRELIGKLGSIGNSNSHQNFPRKENLSSVRKSMALNSSVGEFSTDPGFAERAARLSCFGSKSFNYRSNSLIINDEKLSRVSSSPSLKVLGSEKGYCENTDSPTSPSRDRNELTNSQDESTLSEQNNHPNVEKGLKASMDSTNPRKRKAISKGKVKELPSSSPSNATMVVEVNEKSSSKKCKVAESNENEKESVKNEDDSKKIESNSKPLEPPKDYIHVRARRGQATDSHSLAERVRREKISERMKLLQDLVPGCNKVTGKALMLDEIINYVQSLQHQVEFLSMKLASVNTRVDFNMDSLISKDMYQSGNPIDSSASTFYGQKNQALPSSSSYVAPRATPHCSVDPLDSVLCQNLGIQIPSLNPYSENVSQFPTFGEDDLQTIVQMGFVQNQNQEISLQSQNFNIGSEQVSQMKTEL